MKMETTLRLQRHLRVLILDGGAQLFQLYTKVFDYLTHLAASGKNGGTMKTGRDD
ncbi:MAG: hypothetical protein M5U29_08510 [Anaerolineae bacterium]|nr:hypothetical protein [Anaerolineae bacterium]